MTEENIIEKYLNALNEYKKYYDIIMNASVNMFNDFKEIIKKEYNFDNEIIPLTNNIALKITNFLVPKKFDEIFKENNINNEEEKQRIAEGVFCYACCDIEGEYIVYDLFKYFKIDPNKINEETGKTPLQIVEEISLLDNRYDRRKSNLHNYQGVNLEPPVDPSEIQQYSRYSYIKKVIKDNIQEINDFMSNFGIVLENIQEEIEEPRENIETNLFI